MIPKELVEEFTMHDTIPVENFFVDESENGKGSLIKYSREEIDYFLDLATKTRSPASRNSQQWKTDMYFFESLKHFKLDGKDVAVIGSQTPFYESVCIQAGAKSVTTIEYNRLEYNHPRITTITVEHFYSSNQRIKLFDAVVAISSVDHDGLGRYGDPINPQGDVEAMRELRCMLKPGGLLFVGIPIGPDLIVWNMGRRYGSKRLPVLLDGWRVKQRFGWEESMLHRSSKYQHLYVPIIVLEVDESTL